MNNTLSIFAPAVADRWFDSVMNQGLLGMRNSSSRSVDVRETNDAYLMEMELPGFDEASVEITLHDKVLSISSKDGVVDEDRRNDDVHEFLIRERASMEFARKFSLPDDVDGENISAEFSKGVLSIKIPRKPEQKPRKISIKGL